MGCNCGFGKSDAAEDELTQLTFEIGRVAIVETWHDWQARQRRGQHDMMCKPEKIERLTADACGFASFNRPLQRGDKSRADQIAELAVQQARKLAVLEMTGGHEAQALRLLVGPVGDL